jgi:hypothetical protein
MTSSGDDIRRMRASLRDLPDPALPDGLLESIWRSTCDRRPARRGRVLAAAIIAVAGGAALLAPLAFDSRGGEPHDEYSEDRLAEIEADLRLAMMRVGRALASAERITVGDALGTHAATIVRRGVPATPAAADAAIGQERSESP